MSKFTRVKNSFLALTIILSTMVPGLLAVKLTHAVGANIVADPSFETVNPADLTLPTAWLKGGWGTNTSTFSYLNTGHTGNRAAKVDITSFSSGDAKWYFSPVVVTGSTQYSYSDYYQSTVASYVVAQFGDGSGNYTYTELGTSPVSSAWNQFSVNFSTPASTKDVTIFHLLRGVGSLIIDDVSVTDQTSSPVPTPTPIPVPTPAPAPTPTPTPTTANNLITNPSAELNSSSSANAADGWSTGGWGTNTRSFTVAYGAHTGSKALSATVTGYSSGDAKWYFSPVAVTGNTTYQFSDYYLASISTRVVAQLDDGNGNYTYIELATAPAASSWQLYSGSITSSTSTKKMTIFHLISGVGSLTIDDVILSTSQVTVPITPTPTPTPTPVPTPIMTNLFSNPSLETVNGNTPLGWSQVTWGSNTSTMSYPQVGHTGTYSVRADISNYSSGEAYWANSSIPVTQGKTYVFSDFYQSNAFTQVLVAVKLGNGKINYVWLGNPYTSDGTWTKFYATFVAPASAVSATVYHSISANGYLLTDDYDFEEYVLKGFTEPMVSLTFDDSIATQYTNALPILNAYGMKGTFYVISGSIDTKCVPSAKVICYMSSANVNSLYKSGNEIGSHTVSHPDLTTLTASQVTNELANSQAAISNIIGVPVTDFASPYGKVNSAILNTSQQYYTSHRGVSLGYNSIDNFNSQNLLVQDINSTTTVAQVKSYIDYAKANKVWLILMYHDINVDNTIDPGYDTTPTDFDSQMSYLKTSGVHVVTVAQGLQLTIPQL